MPGERRPQREELAGRDGDLKQVRDLLSEAVAGRAGGLLIAGEAGVGKTSLARRACADAADEVACLWGAACRCSPPRCRSCRWPLRSGTGPIPRPRRYPGRTWRLPVTPRPGSTPG